MIQKKEILILVSCYNNEDEVVKFANHLSIQTFSEKIFLQHRQAAYQPNCNFNFRQRACHRVRNGAV